LQASSNATRDDFPERGVQEEAPSERDDFPEQEEDKSIEPEDFPARNGDNDDDGKDRDDDSKDRDDDGKDRDDDSKDRDDVNKNLGPTTQGGGCLIATAAFGSELTPEVQFLRDFRDEKILSTISGSSFMNVFNAWYYSFSPSVANYERGQPWLQDTIKIGIYPLLNILQLSEKSYSLLPGEYGSVAAGTTASILIGFVYFTPLVLGLKLVKTKRKINFKIYAIVIIAVTAALLMAILVGDKIALTIMTPLFVVILCAISSIVCAKVIVILRNTLFVGMKMPHRLNGKT
jgi:hypothetical protein